MATTASPSVSSTIGLKDFRIAKLLTDTSSTTTYGDPQLVSGVIEATITNDSTDADIQYADDVEFDRINPDPEISVKIKLADLPLSIQSMILGNSIDDNGVLVETAGDKSPYFAIGFRAEKANGNYRYIWLLKCSAKPVSETYATKEGKTITRQNPEIEFDAIKRVSDQQYRYKLDEGENGATSATCASFLSTVYTPDFTSCALSALTLADVTLTPTFASGTTAYTGTTTAASSALTATAGTGATVTAMNGDTAITLTSGSGTVTWNSGTNTLTITVTKDSAHRTYTVVVTKS